MGNRHRAREIAIQLLYQCDGVAREQSEDIIKGYFSGGPVNGETRNYAEQLARGTLDKLEGIDLLLSQASDNWSLGRILTVDLVILRLSTFEMLFLNTAPAVAIDEAVRLAKRFSSEDSPSFVNGVLDMVKELACHEVDGAGVLEERP